MDKLSLTELLERIKDFERVVDDSKYPLTFKSPWILLSQEVHARAMNYRDAGDKPLDGIKEYLNSFFPLLEKAIHISNFYLVEERYEVIK